MKDQSSSAWLQLICEQLTLLWEKKKEVPLLRIVAWGLCYRLISKGAFLGDGDFHPSERKRGTSLPWCTCQKFFAELLKSCDPVCGNTRGWQAGYLQIKKFMLSFNMGVKSTRYQIFISGIPCSHREQKQAGPRGQATSADLWKMKLWSETGDRVSLGYLSSHCLGEKFTAHCRAKGKDSLMIKKIKLQSTTKTESGSQTSWFWLWCWKIWETTLKNLD